MVLGLKWDKQSSGGTKYVLGIRVLDASIHLSKDSLENTWVMLGVYILRGKKL